MFGLKYWSFYTKNTSGIAKTALQGWVGGWRVPWTERNAGWCKKAAFSASLALPHIANGLIQTVWYQIRGAQNNHHPFDCLDSIIALLFVLRSGAAAALTLSEEQVNLQNKRICKISQYTFPKLVEAVRCPWAGEGALGSTVQFLSALSSPWNPYGTTFSGTTASSARATTGFYGLEQWLQVHLSTASDAQVAEFN